MSIFDRFRLSNKRLFITGGSRGLGREMVRALAGAGADVVIASRKYDSCAALAEEVSAQTGRRALAVACHVGRWADCDALVAETEDAFPGDWLVECTEESLRNEYALHSAIHAWMAAPAGLDFATLDGRVYKSLFATPKEDPWLGLAEVEVLTGLDDDGVIVSSEEGAAKTETP